MPIQNQPPALPADLAAAVSDPAKLNELIETRVQARTAELLAAQERKAHIAEFAGRIVGGTKETPFGLPVTVAEVTELMSAVSPEAQTRLEGLLTKVVKDGFLHFSESGHDRQLLSAGAKKLDPKMVKIFKNLQASNKEYTIEEFFKANTDILGDISDYNLAEFVAPPPAAAPAKKEK